MIREDSSDGLSASVNSPQSPEITPASGSHEQGFLNHSLLYQFFEKMAPQRPSNAALLPGLTDSIQLKKYQKRDIELMFQMEERPIPFESCLLSRKRCIRGGMLAEDMGTGKTVCIIGLILKSKGKVPYSVVQTGRGVVPLKQMCAELIRNPICNFQERFHTLPTDLVDYLQNLTPLPRSYIHYPPMRTRGSVTKGVRIHLTKATLLVIPPALMQQVQQEFNKFTVPNALEILYCSKQDDLPASPEGFWPYDVVVISNLLLRTASTNLTQRVIQREKCTMACQFLSPGCPNCEQGAEPSVLLRTHWLRVVVDEGHIMGAQSSNQTRLAKMLFAERRWLVSGTPTPDAEPSRELEYLFGLLVFVRILDDTRECRTLWRKYVAEPYEEEARRDWSSLSASSSSTVDVAEERSVPVLEALLCHVLVRNNSGVIERENPLPPLHPPKVRVLPFQVEEAIRYQQLVGQIHTNLITSRFDEQDCLFHPRNSRSALEAFTTLRRSGTWFAGLQRFERDVCNESIHDDLYGLAEKPYPVNASHSRTLVEIFNTLRWNAFRQVEDTFASAKLNYVLTRLSTPPEQGGLAGEKVIVFSMFTETLAWLAEELKRNKINFCEFYTNLKPEARASALVTFNTSTEKHVILMKTELAAYGINLACASHIFFMEPVLDRTKEQQAIKRAHRIGHDPDKPVTVEKLVMEDTLEHMQLLNDGNFGLALDPPSAALVVALDPSLSPPYYEREFRVLNGIPPYRFLCAPSKFPEGVEFGIDGNKGILRVYVPRSLPPVHPFSIQVIDSRGAIGVGYYLIEFPSKLREFDNIAKIGKKKRRDAAESRKHHVFLGNLPLLRISQSAVTSHEERQLLGAFLEGLDAEPKMPWVPRSVTEFVPSIVPPNLTKVNSAAMNQLLRRTPQRKPKEESPIGSPIDFDDDIQIAASVEVIDFGKSSRKRKVQFALPTEEDDSNVQKESPFGKTESAIAEEARIEYTKDNMQN